MSYAVDGHAIDQQPLSHITGYLTLRISLHHTEPQSPYSYPIYSPSTEST